MIGTIFAIVVPVLGGVWFIVNKAVGFGQFSHRVDEMDKRTCHAACDVHSEDIAEVKSDVKEIRDDVVALKSQFSIHDRDIERIREHLETASENLMRVTSLLLLKYKDAGKLFSVKRSPRQLNEMGKQVYADMKGEEFLIANKEFLFSQIDSFHPKMALDVENAAHAVCITSIENDIFNRLKDFVYNSPSYRITDAEGNERMYDLALSDVCFVLSLPLRDMYLAAHSEIVSE